MDYHGNVNWEIYLRWWTGKLIPNLPPKCVIVMDNASYHSVRRDDFVWPPGVTPSKANKGVLSDYLMHCGIDFDEKLKKKELYSLVKGHFEDSASEALRQHLGPDQHIL